MKPRQRTFRVTVVVTSVLAIQVSAGDADRARTFAEDVCRPQLDDARHCGFEFLHDAVQATNIQEVLL